MIFCPNFSNKQVKQEFDELVQAVGEDMAYLLWDRNNGYALDKAPNGADSELFLSLLDYYLGDRQKAIQIKSKVYSERFKNWFGDWVRPFSPNLDAVDDSKVDVVYVRKPWKNDRSKSNDSWRIYLKGLHNKGYFELVKDEEGINYSVHFKTSTEKHLSKDIYDSVTNTKFTPDPSTKEERSVLFEQLRNLIPDGAMISTWGELSPGGPIALDRVGNGWLKINERKVKTKTGEPLIIPVYQKPSDVSKAVDKNGEPRLVFHGTEANFDTFSKEKRGKKTGSPSARKAFWAASNVENAWRYAGLNRLGTLNNKEIKSYSELFEERDPFEDYPYGPSAIELMLDEAYYESEKLLRNSDIIQNFIKENKYLGGNHYYYYIGALEDMFSNTELYNNNKEEIDSLIRKVNNIFEAAEKSLEERYEKYYLYHVKACYLNIKDIKIDNDNFDPTQTSSWIRIQSYSLRVDDAIKQHKNGGVIYNTADPVFTDVYYFFNSDQIKSIESNFSTESDNLYAKEVIEEAQSQENIIKSTDIFNRLLNGSVVYSSEIFDEFILKGMIPSDIRTLVDILARHNIAVTYSPVIKGYNDALAITVTTGNKNTIIISESGINESSEELLRTIAHEVVHALTVKELKTNPDGQLAKLSKYLYNKYKDTFKAYGFKDIKEFVAEFASNRNFRDQIRLLAESSEYEGVVGKLKLFIDAIANMICNKVIFGKNIKEYKNYKKNLINYLNNQEQITLSGALNTQELNDYLSETQIRYFIDRENRYQDAEYLLIRDMFELTYLKDIFPTDDQISEAELNARERETPDFDVEERRQIDTERRQLGVKDKMRKRYQEAKLAARKAKEFITYRAKGLRNTAQQNLDNITTKIIEGTISKDKAYRLRMKSNSLTSYQEQLVLDNQEAVREVKKRHATLLEAQRSRLANFELLTKLELFVDFIQHADDEISNMYKMLRNARANRYRQIYYKTTNNGRRIYTDENGNLFTSQSTDNDLSVDEFGFDELQYTNTDVVGYYSTIIDDMVKMLDDINDMLPTDGNPEEVELNSQISQAYNTLRSLLTDTNIINNMRGLKNLYSHALQERVEDLIDQVIDEQDATSLTPDMKKRLKITTKKWLKNQNDFGDIKAYERWIGLGTRSKSSLVRIVQEIINKDWDSIQTSSNEVGHNLGALYQKALGKARNLGYKFGPKNFSKRLMAMDYRGLPTGYFIQPINKGQYYQDLNDIKTKLLFCKSGVRDLIYNFQDENGNYIFRDVNGEFNLELNEYGDPIFPETPLLDDICRNYYRKMESWISDHANRRYTKKYYVERVNYLSPSTLRLMNEMLSKINSIRSVATINGEFRPDMLTLTLLEDLSQYQREYSDLTNPYNADGTLKDDGDAYGKAARELTAWLAHMRGKIVYESDIDAYQKAREHARDKRRFDELFTKIAINPLLWKMISKNNNEEIAISIQERIKELKQRRSKLLSHIKTDRFTKLNWDLIVDKETGELKSPEFWSELRRLDGEIQELTAEIYEQLGGEKNEGDVTFSDLFTYTYLALDPTKDIAPRYEESMMRSVVDGYREYLVKAHPDWMQSQIDQEVNDKFWVNDRALSIFTTPFPKSISGFTYEGLKYPSVVRTPNSLFMKVNKEKSDSEYLNVEYDDNNSDFIQPKESIYRDERYYQFMNESLENKDLYNALIDNMKESFLKLPFVRPYDYRLPLIGEDRLSNIMMRNIHSRFGLNLKYFFNRRLDINETDVDIVQDGTVRRPDGSPILNIPIRFIQMLDKPEYISSDVVGNVVQFFRMAENYRLKAKSAPKLMSILDAVSENDEEGTISNQTQVIKGMLDRLIYEDNTTGLNRDRVTKKWKHFNWIRKIFGDTIQSALKRLGQIRSVLAGSMLKLNLSSAVVSFLDPFTSLFINSVTAKYFGVKDLAFAFTLLIANAPTALMGLGSTRTYNKINAAMLYFGITKDVKQTFRRMDEGSLRRFLTDNLLMKGFELGDYTLQALNMTATLHAFRQYVDSEGNVTYLSKYDFMNKAQLDGMTVKEAKRLYRRSRSLYSNLKVDKKGNLVFKDQNQDPKQLVYKVGKLARQTGSYLTGVVTDTERTGLQTNIFTSFITMMRNFLIVGFWERFGTMRDFQVQGEPVVDPDTGEVKFEYSNTPSTPEEKLKIKDTQVYYRGGFDFSTGRIENSIFTSLFSWIRHMWPYLKYAATSIHTNKYDTSRADYLKLNNLNEDDIRSAQRVLCELSTIGALLLCSVGLNTLLKDKDPDDDDYYLLYLLNLLTIRLTIDRTVWFSPTTVSDLITSITPAIGGMGKMSHIGDLIVEGLGLSKHKLDDPVKSGNYKDKDRLFYHTFNVGSIVGMNNWYTNMPKFLGGGGAYVLNQKARWYKKLVPLSDLIYGEKHEDKKNKKKRKSAYKDPYLEQVNRELRELNRVDQDDLYGY